jgi:hypothetical protein
MDSSIEHIQESDGRQSPRALSLSRIMTYHEESAGLNPQGSSADQLTQAWYGL